MQLETLVNEINTKQLSNRNLKLKLSFSEPVPNIFSDWIVNQEVVSFNIDHFFINKTSDDSPMVYVTNRSNSRYGRRFNNRYVEKLISIEPLPRVNQVFDTYDKFLKQFDTKYIAEEKVLALWNDSYGRKWSKKDFKPMGSVGKKLFTTFSKNFKGYNDIAVELSGVYRPNGYGHKDYGEHYSAYRGNGRGRDITIRHTQGFNYVYYASEYPGCGNGSYGVVARRNVWLHIEDD